MAVQYIRDHTSGTSGSGTSITATLAADVPAGNLLAVWFGFDNTSATTPTVSSLDTPGGESATWARVASHDSSAAGSAAGVRGELWVIRTTQVWTSGTVITGTLSASPPKSTATCREFSGVLATARGTSTPGTSTGGTPSAVTSGTALVAGDLVIGGATFETSTTPTDDTDTTNGSWSVGLVGSATGGATAAQVRSVQQWKIVAATGVQTYNPTANSTDSGAAVVGLQLDPSITIPAEQPTAAGAAQDAGVSAAPAAEQPTAAGSAGDATVSTGGGGGGQITKRSTTGTSATTPDVNNQTSLACAIDANTQNGDVLVALLVIGGNQSTITPPANWTAIRAPVDDSTTLRAQWFWTRWTTGDSTNPSWSIATAANSITIVMSPAYAGVVVSGTPIDNAGAAESGTVETGTTVATHTAAAITTVTADCWVLTAFAERTGGGTTWTPPTGQTERADRTNSNTFAGWMANGEINDSDGGVAAGSQGPFTATASQASSTAVMFAAALKPEPAAGGTSANAEAATATGAADDAPLTIGPTADAPAGDSTAASLDAGLSGAPTAEQPTATGTAADATISTANFTNAPAESPTATGAAGDAGGALRIPAEQPTATGTGYDATVSSGANPAAETASAGGTAYDATTSTIAPATVEVGAIRWVAAEGTAVFAESPTASGTAADPHANVAVHAGAGLVLGSATGSQGGYDRLVGFFTDTNEYLQLTDGTVPANAYAYLVVHWHVAAATAGTDLTAIKAAHPKAKVLAYQNFAGMIAGPHTSSRPTTLVTQEEASAHGTGADDWRLHKESDASVVTFSDFAFLQAANIGLASWRTQASSHFAQIATDGFHGVMLDDVNMVPGHGFNEGDPGDSVEFASDAGYRDATTAAMAVLTPAARTQGLLVVPNVGMDPWTAAHYAGYQELLGAGSLDGVLREFWMAWAEDTVLFTDATWTDTLKVQTDAEAAGRFAVLNTYPMSSPDHPRSIRYGLASFYIAWDGQAASGFGYNDGRPLSEQGTYRTNLGRPLEARQAVGVGFSRRYTDGIALVNPSGSASQDFTLDQPYVDETGAFVSGLVTLTSGTGRLLTLVTADITAGIPAGSPSAVGTGYDATVTTSGATSAPAEAATATGAANDLGATVATAAEQPTATGAGQDATGTIATAGELATVTATGADAQATIAVAAEVASAAGSAADATISTSAASNPQAEQPTATGTAGDPQTSIAVPAEQPTAAGVASIAAVSTAAFTNCAAEAATAAGTGNDAAGVNATAGIGAATGTGSADNAAVTFARDAPAEAATATGSALDAQAAVAVLAEAAAIIAAALDVIIPKQAVPGYGTVTIGGTPGTVIAQPASGRVTVG